MTAMRQVGVTSLGGAEVLAISPQLLFDEWVAGSLETPLAQFKVDEQLPGNDRVACSEDFSKQPPFQARSSGRLEAPRALFCRTGRSRTNAKCRNMWAVPLARSLALGMVSADARLHVAGQQAAGLVPLVGAHSDALKCIPEQRAPTSKHPAWPRKACKRGLTHGVLCKKVKGWRISGSWMMVISCATQRWSSLPRSLWHSQCEDWCRKDSAKNRSHPLRFRSGQH